MVACGTRRGRHSSTAPRQWWSRASCNRVTLRQRDACVPQTAARSCIVRAGPCVGHRCVSPHGPGAHAPQWRPVFMSASCDALPHGRRPLGGTAPHGWPRHSCTGACIAPRPCAVTCLITVMRCQWSREHACNTGRVPAHSAHSRRAVLTLGATGRPSRATHSHCQASATASSPHRTY